MFNRIHGKMAKEKAKKCKVKVREKNGKMVMEMRGYCDMAHPNKKTDRDFEMDMGDMD